MKRITKAACRNLRLGGTTYPQSSISGSEASANVEIYRCGKQADNAGQADTTAKLANELQHGNTHHSGRNENSLDQEKSRFLP